MIIEISKEQRVYLLNLINKEIDGLAAKICIAPEEDLRELNGKVVELGVLKGTLIQSRHFCADAVFGPRGNR